MHIYEPVPEFYDNLEKVWSDHTKTNQWKVSVHNYGLGDSTRTIVLTQADIQGQGTFGMKDNEGDDEKTVELEITDASTALRHVTGEAGEYHQVKPSPQYQVNLQFRPWKLDHDKVIIRIL